jgi:hypothetical protein
MPDIVRVMGDGGLGSASVKDAWVGLVSRAVWQRLGQCGRGDTGSGCASLESMRLDVGENHDCALVRLHRCGGSPVLCRLHVALEPQSWCQDFAGCGWCGLRCGRRRQGQSARARLEGQRRRVRPIAGGQDQAATWWRQGIQRRVGVAMAKGK